jgi:hypothetical protein
MGWQWAGVSFLTVSRRDVERLRASGLYAFVAHSGGVQRLLYVGESDDISRAVGPHHPAWDDALAAGFNEIHVCLQTASRIDRLQLLSRIARAEAPVLDAGGAERAAG